MTRADKWLVAGAIIIAVVLLVGWNAHYFSGDPGATAVIKVMGEDYSRVSLEGTDQVIKVEGKLGTSTIEIKDGAVRMVDSPCPEKICVHQGWVSRPNQSIICVPNEISIAISGTGDVDAVTK